MAQAVLSKKQRKQMRKQMQVRKQALLARHGRGGEGGDASGFAPARPKLPADPRPTPAGPAKRWTPPTPARSLAASTPPVRPEPVPVKEAAATPAPERAVVGPRPQTMWRASPPAVATVQDLDAPGPGPLTRAAAGLEGLARRSAAAYRERPWKDAPIRRRAQAHRTLARVVTPLRLLGLVMVLGSLALAREVRLAGASDTGALVVLGMGLGAAVVLLALGEIARALQVVVRRASAA